MGGQVHDGEVAEGVLRRVGIENSGACEGDGSAREETANGTWCLGLKKFNAQ